MKTQKYRDSEVERLTCFLSIASVDAVELFSMTPVVIPSCEFPSTDGLSRGVPGKLFRMRVSAMRGESSVSIVDRLDGHWQETTTLG